MMNPADFTMTPVQPMDPDALAEMHRQIAARNEERARLQLAARNRAAGKPAPSPGDVMYVTPARGIKFRGRAGIRFSDAERTKVVVADQARVIGPGEVCTTVDGAEQILGDDSLVVFTTAAAAGDAQALRAQLEARDAELESARSEIERLKADARRNAKDPGDGTPGRLRAAAAVKDKGGLEP